MVPVQRILLRPFWLSVVLLTIAFHAVVPYGSPFLRTTGSAFSVTTVDVSLAPKRKERTETPVAREADEPGFDIGAPPGDQSENVRSPLPDRRPLRPFSTAAAGKEVAAARFIAAGGLGARAPPTA